MGTLKSRKYRREIVKVYKNTCGTKIVDYEIVTYSQ